MKRLIALVLVCSALTACAPLDMRVSVNAPDPTPVARSRPVIVTVEKSVMVETGGGFDAPLFVVGGTIIMLLCLLLAIGMIQYDMSRRHEAEHRQHAAPVVREIIRENRVSTIIVPLAVGATVDDVINVMVQAGYDQRDARQLIEERRVRLLAKPEGR